MCIRDSGTPTITVDGTHLATPTASVKASGPDTAKVFAFDFKGLRGAPGKDGGTGPQGPAAGFGTPTITVDNTHLATPTATVSASGPDTAKVFNFSFKGLKGTPGAPGWVNVNLTDLDNEKNYIAQVQRGERTMLNVLSGNYSVGIVFQYSDSMGHVLTQEFLTHYIVHQGFTGATANLKTHDHNRIVKLTRIYSTKQSWPIQYILGPSKFVNDEVYTWGFDYFENLGYNVSGWPTRPSNDVWTWPAGRWTPWRDMALEDAICADNRWKSDKHAGVRDQYVLCVTEAPGVTTQLASTTQRGTLVYVSNGKTNMGGAIYGLAMYVGGTYYQNWSKTEQENRAISQGWLVRTNLGNVYKAEQAYGVLNPNLAGPMIVNASSILQNTYSKSEVNNLLSPKADKAWVQKDYAPLSDYSELKGQFNSYKSSNDAAVAKCVQAGKTVINGGNNGAGGYTPIYVTKNKSLYFVRFLAGTMTSSKRHELQLKFPSDYINTPLPQTLMVVCDGNPTTEQTLLFSRTVYAGSTSTANRVNFGNFDGATGWKFGNGKFLPTLIFQFYAVDGFVFITQVY